MKYISLGVINRKFLIPVLGGIIGLIFKIFIRYSPKIGIILENPFLFNMYVTLGLVFAFIPFLIIKYRSKAEHKIYNEQIIKSKLYKKLKDSKNVIKKMKFKKYRFIFYSTFFDFLQAFLLNLFIATFVYNLWIFDIIFISLFSFLILKTKYYKHQFISMTIIIVLGLGLNIIAYFKLGDAEDKLKLFDIFIKFISEICFSLCVVIMKYNMEKNYCDPFEFCIWQGFFGFILHSICLAVFCLFALSANGIQHPDNLKKYFKEFDYNDLIVCLAIIIVHFIYNILIFLTCDYFTPIHILISPIIKETFIYLQPDSNLSLNILGIVLLILIAIMFLVFIEVIEINIFKISYNTKKNIELRSNNESSIEFNSIHLLNDEPEPDEQSESSISSPNPDNNT